MNKLTIIGNLTRDPELRTTSTGINVCTFTVAVNRRQRSQTGEAQNEADFFRVTAWRQLGEICQKYLSKGRKIAVEGSIQNRSYTAQDGSKRYVTEIIADNVEFLDRAPETASQPAAQAPKADPPKQMRADEFIELPDDDELPF